MAAMSSPIPPSSSASSSRKATSPLARSSSKPLMSELFKIRLPRDLVVEPHEPWALKIDDVISVTNTPSRRDVLLVLGVPSLRDLQPFLQSQQLESSLLILATNQPPNITSALPAIHILRLSEPLALEDAGAVRFVTILECAERIARVWRKTGGKGMQESSEAEMEITSGSLPLPTVFRFVSESTPNSPQYSSEELAIREKPVTRRRTRTMSSIGIKSPGVPLPPADIFQRPFDSILNFLPSGVSDKALLKQSILVTTISRPFLTALSDPIRPGTASSASAPAHRRRRSKGLSQNSIYSAPATPSNRSRSSLFTSLHSPSNSISSMPPVTTPPRRARLIHLIPPIRQPTISRAKLMQSMESFLCSFAYPSMLGIGGSDSAGVERAAPYLLHPYALRGIVQHTPAAGLLAGENDKVTFEWTIAELVLSGALDYSLKKGEVGLKSAPRAWISSPNDITFVTTSRRELMGSVNFLQRPLSPTIRERQREGGGSNGGAFLWNGSVERNIGTPMGDSGIGSPAETSPSYSTGMNITLNSNSTITTPPTTPPSPMEKVFRVPFRVSSSGEKMVATPLPSTPTTDSDDSDSSGASTDDRIVMQVVHGEKREKTSLFKHIVKQGKEHSKWKFWKVSFATTAA